MKIPPERAVQFNHNYVFSPAGYRRSSILFPLSVNFKLPKIH